MKIHSVLFLLFAGVVEISVVGAFVPTRRSARSAVVAKPHPMVAADASVEKFPIKPVVTDQDVLNIAAFRNNLKNPEIMVKEAQRKRRETDNTASALQGLQIGFINVGLPLAAIIYWKSQDVMETLKFYAATGGTMGIALGINNYLGRSVYVMDEAEATNRILVDFAEGLKRKFDIGFFALSEDSMFEPAGGVMGCVDCQLRNSEKSPVGVQVVPDYPPHLHIKNMEVHESMRRQGIGMALLDALEKFAKEETDADRLTLEVEEENVGAVRLYEKAGFQFTKHPITKLTKRKFMAKRL